jgi:hypothetical protein
MAVNISITQIAADRRLGDGVTAPAEPIHGILTRLLATATDIVESYAPAAPEAVSNTATSLIVGYLFDASVSDATRFSNALANSGAQAMLSRWQSQRVAIIGDKASDVGGLSGLTRVGSQGVNVVIAGQWVATSLPLPATAIIGAELVYPNGTTTGIELFGNALLTDPPVTPGSQAEVSTYSIGRTADNLIALASTQVGQHRLTIWAVE